VHDSARITVLHELIAALDRRIPQMKRAGEAAIARDAAALRMRALERIAELETSAGVSGIAAHSIV
jgi:hypothetical protein